MRSTILTALLVLVAAPAAAQDAAPAPLMPKRGELVRDANATRIAAIERVNPDGSVKIIFGSRFVTIPANKLQVAADGVTTTLTRREVSRLP